MNRSGTKSQNPSEILENAYKKAISPKKSPIIKDTKISHSVNLLCRNIHNRACVRLLLSCLLAKIHKPKVDIRKPYTEIGDMDAYSGRSYDEKYVHAFVIKYGLPCNPTTAFLTPALRNRNIALTPDVELEGKPKKLYKHVLGLLDVVNKKSISAEDLLVDMISCLIVYGKERDQSLKRLLGELSTAKEGIPLSSEEIVTLIQQHLHCPRSSRLPVLVVAAAYKSAENYLKEKVLPLRPHTSADSQTGALGDLEITLIDDNNIVTSYEMKKKRIIKNDIDHVITKISHSGKQIDNYIFITTETIDNDVSEYAKSMYEKTGGVEIAILDYIGFLRHFLHLFHRLRLVFLDTYQDLLLIEPESSVRQELKEAFLALRKAAESDR